MGRLFGFKYIRRVSEQTSKFQWVHDYMAFAGIFTKNTVVGAAHSTPSALCVHENKTSLLYVCYSDDTWAILFRN